MSQHLDVVIVGAGISGIAAAYFLQEKCPSKSFAVLEAREDIGGTWSLFRYPGIRSDSDMYTFGYSFYPWKDPRAMAPGPAILEYLNEVVDEFGIRDKIRLGTRVERMDFSTEENSWTVQARDAESGELREYSCDFFWGCTGYYRYDAGYTPEFEGVERFEGPIVHPQQWTDDIDYAQKRVIVIGSGATAVTLVPSLAEKAEHVTMLQRSPSYVVSIPRDDRVNRTLSKLLGEERAFPIIRGRYLLMSMGFYQLSRSFPRLARRLFVAGVRKALGPDFDVDKHFNPSYEPWDQRLCMVPDGDLFEAINQGKVSVVTDEIDSFTERGIALRSGEELEAELIVTATGLTLQLFGGAELSVDGQPVDVSRRLGYKGVMLAGVPNFAFTLGYVNASWTLRAEISSRYVCELIRTMSEKGYVRCCPPLEPDVELDTPVDLSSGYFQRSVHILPRRGKRRPWRAEQNWIIDRHTTLRTPVEDGILELIPGAVAEASRGDLREPAQELKEP